MVNKLLKLIDLGAGPIVISSLFSLTQYDRKGRPHLPCNHWKEV